MSTANNPDNNLSPWQPGQSGNPSGRPKGTRDLAGYVLETTDGGKELVDALLSPLAPQFGQSKRIGFHLVIESRYARDYIPKFQTKVHVAEEELDGPFQRLVQGYRQITFRNGIT
jgi:hypothetical protein